MPVLRFTPTGVGTIFAMRCRILSRAVHPHGRGDNVMRRCRLSSIVGSPPRAWGQLQRIRMIVNAERFTPTGVGTIFR